MPLSLPNGNSKDASSISERLGECLQRITDAEAILASTRETLKDLSKETATTAGFKSAVPAQQRTVNLDELTKQASANSLKEESGLSEEAAFEDRVRKRGCLQSKILNYLRKERDESDACMQLPAALLLVLCFVWMVSSHFQLDRLHAIDNAITFDIEENANFAFTGIIPFENGRMGHKTVHDVNSIPDFWSFFELGLVPLWWPVQENFGYSEVRSNVASGCTGPQSALSGFAWPNDTIQQVSDVPIEYGAAGSACPTIPTGTDVFTYPDGVLDLKVVGNVPRRTPTYLYFHSIVGGVRLSQEQTDVVDCTATGKPRQHTVHAGRCVGHEEVYTLAPEMHQSLHISEELIDRPGGRTQYLLAGKTQTEIISELRALEDATWFNPRTSKIEIMFTTVNPHQDLLTATFIMFFFNRAGHIHKIVEPVSIWLDPYHDHDPLCYLTDILWVLLLLKIFLEEGWSIVQEVSQLGLIGGIVDYAEPSNAVDWLNIAYSIALMVLWFLHIFNVQGLQKLLAKGDVEVLGTWSDAQDRIDFFALCHATVVHQQTFRTVLAVYPFVIVSRFFKAFNSQPRLSMVTRTLSKAAVGIIHFAVVFAVVFGIFAISAWLLFGQELEYFANLARSIHSTFRIMIGDFDWEVLHQVGRPQAYIWFWSLQWGLNMVMLNMLLAIIMDVYSEVSSGILAQPHVETLWSQSYEIASRFWGVRTGKMLGLHKVLHTLDPTDLDEDDSDGEPDPLLTIEGFQEKVPGLSEAQAVEIMTEAELWAEVKPEPLAEAKSSIQIVDDQVRQLQASVDQLLHMASGSLAANPKSKGWAGCLGPKGWSV